MQFLLDVVELFVQPVQGLFVFFRSEFFRQRVGFVLQFVQMRQPAASFLQQCAVRSEFQLLLEQRDFDLLRLIDHAGIRVVVADQNVQQRGFAAPVRADQRNPLTGTHFEVDVFQNGFGVKSPVEITNGKQQHGKKCRMSKFKGRKK